MLIYSYSLINRVLLTVGFVNSAALISNVFISVVRPTGWTSGTQLIFMSKASPWVGHLNYSIQAAVVNMK